MPSLGGGWVSPPSMGDGSGVGWRWTRTLLPFVCAGFIISEESTILVRVRAYTPVWTFLMHPESHFDRIHTVHTPLSEALRFSTGWKPWLCVSFRNVGLTLFFHHAETMSTREPHVWYYFRRSLKFRILKGILYVQTCVKQHLPDLKTFFLSNLHVFVSFFGRIDGEYAHYECIDPA